LRPFKKAGPYRCGRCRHSENPSSLRIERASPEIIFVNSPTASSTHSFKDFRISIVNQPDILCFMENVYFKEASGFVAEESAKVHET
jgi:hypothetical protein